MWAFCWVRFSLSQFPACWVSSHWTFFMFSLHCGIYCQVGFCCAWPLPCGGRAEVVSARLNPRHGTIYVGGVCNFLGCVSPQQRFEMVDQCYSSVTAEFYSASKGEMWGQADPKGEASIRIGFLLLYICLLPPLSLLYANLTGHKGVVFVSPEVLTLAHGFCFVSFLQAFPFLCLLATAILDSFFLF